MPALLNSSVLTACGGIFLLPACFSDITEQEPTKAAYYSSQVELAMNNNYVSARSWNHLYCKFVTEIFKASSTGCQNSFAPNLNSHFQPCLTFCKRANSR